MLGISKPLISSQVTSTRRNKSYVLNCDTTRCSRTHRPRRLHSHLLKYFVQGYLAMTLMLHEHSELLLMVVNSIKKDLEENNEYNNCLALHAIANVGSNEMAENLGPSVHRLLISPYVHLVSDIGTLTNLDALELHQTLLRKRPHSHYYGCTESTQKSCLPRNGLNESCLSWTMMI
jgi:hypothetical protein